MTFQVFQPHPSLQPYIRYYWSITGRQEHHRPIDLLPDGGVSLLLNLGANIHSSRFGTTWCEHRALIVGAMVNGDRQFLHGESLLFGITFKPGAFTHFHRYEPLDRVANSVLGFDPDLFPDTDMIRRKTNSYLDGFYIDRISPPRFSLLEVVSHIEQCQGRVRVEDLMRDYFLTARQLERQFKLHVGLSPKEFINLTRFNHSFRMVERLGGTRSLMEIAWDCGYYDHAHMSHAFQKHMGYPPGDLILSHSSKIPVY